MDEIIRLRHELHQNPELSGCEVETARTIVRFFEGLNPDQTIDGIGGHGVAIVFEGAAAGPTVMLRCELDALPIREVNDTPYKSRCDGVSHKCGHDGHMAILAAVGMQLARQRPKCGRVVLLFQPAEETGQGAAKVLNDPKFESIQPDFVFALHNLPGYPLGQVIIRPGVFNCASRGVAIKLSGSTAHAAQPETGSSPASAMCRLIQCLSRLSDDLAIDGETAFATVVGARLGERAFGTAPGHAEVWVTLRSETDTTMARMIGHVERLCEEITIKENLKFEISFEDIFDSTVNSPSAVEIVKQSVEGGNLLEPEKPFRWSEDFGQFTAKYPGALFGIGAGLEVPDLHNPNYDFPDRLISIGANVFLRIVDELLNGGI